MPLASVLGSTPEGPSVPERGKAPGALLPPWSGAVGDGPAGVGEASRGRDGDAEWLRVVSSRRSMSSQEWRAAATWLSSAAFSPTR
jgi:hypothetical protein